jgi:hypothetical protein
MNVTIRWSFIGFLHHVIYALAAQVSSRRTPFEALVGLIKAVTSSWCRWYRSWLES